MGLGRVLTAAGLSGLVCVGLAGCAAAIPAVSAISAGAAAGEKGYSFWSSGRLYYVDEGTTDEMTVAVRRMIDRLELTIHDEREKFDGDEFESRAWSLRTQRGHLLWLTIEPLTPVLTAVELDAGVFGNEAAAQLVAQRVKDELDAIQKAAAMERSRTSEPAE